MEKLFLFFFAREIQEEIFRMDLIFFIFFFFNFGWGIIPEYLRKKKEKNPGNSRKKNFHMIGFNFLILIRKLYHICGKKNN